MKLKQTTFDFDFPAEESKSAEKIMKQEVPVAIQAEPIEVDIPVAMVQEPPEGIRKSTRGRMKLSDMHSGENVIEIPEDAILFSKSYYSIGTVADMFKVNQSLIRFWENEFDILKPKKNAKGDRFFRPEDVKNLRLIYHLLRERKYTIDGARDFLKKSKHADKKFELIESLKGLKSFLQELKASL
jgi:DNA-binding transcriptional MerR regulator